jgi:YfiH family protein
MAAVAATESSVLRQGPPGLWRLTGWGPSWVTAGIVGPPAEHSRLITHLPAARRVIQAEQVHGSSIAVVQHAREDTRPVAGCDALLTSVPGVGLVIRTADCLPIFLLDPRRRAIGIAHAGWRGLAAGLPLRLVAAFRHLYHSVPSALRVAIGPAIRSCCYEVGPEFETRFGSFVQVRDGRRTCDLIGVAIEQLQRGGVSPARIVDSGQCTSCSSSSWCSIRRDGQETGRLLSFIAIR